MVFNSAQRKNTGQGACWWLNFAQIERLRDFFTRQDVLECKIQCFGVF